MIKIGLQPFKMALEIIEFRTILHHFLILSAEFIISFDYGDEIHELLVHREVCALPSMKLRSPAHNFMLGRAQTSRCRGSVHL